MCLAPLQVGAHTGNPLMDSLVLVCTWWVGCPRRRAQSQQSAGATFLSRCLGSARLLHLCFCSAGVIDPSHQLVLGRPDLIYPQRGACLWADSPLWRSSSSSSSYKLALVSLLDSHFLLILLFFNFLFLSLSTHPPFSHPALRPCDCLR